VEGISAASVRILAVGSLHNLDRTIAEGSRIDHIAVPASSSIAYLPEDTFTAFLACSSASFLGVVES